MARYTRPYQTETQGRESTGSRGPALRPSRFTLDLASNFSCPIDSGGSVDWTDTTYRVTPRFKDGPIMDDQGQYSISTKDIVLGAGTFIAEICLLITNTGASAHTVQAAMVTPAGALYQEYPELDIPAGQTVMITNTRLTHNAPEDTVNEYAIAVVQRDAGSAELEVESDYIGAIKKIGQSDQTVRL